jgi:hypothetical protein
MLEITCTACKRAQPLAVACSYCGKNVSPLLKNISGEVRSQLSGMIADEAAMLRRMARTKGAVADWIAGSPARRKRARAALHLPKGWQFRRGKSSGRARPVELPPLTRARVRGA